MKAIFTLCVVLLLSGGLFSCTPESINDKSNPYQACCGDDLNVPPAPINGKG